jgi:hypothetical protein
VHGIHQHLISADCRHAISCHAKITGIYDNQPMATSSTPKGDLTSKANTTEIMQTKTYDQNQRIMMRLQWWVYGGYFIDCSHHSFSE